MSLPPTLIAPWLPGSGRKPLPRFFFDVQDGFVSPDDTGTELPGVVQARMEAVRFAGVHLSHEPELVWDGRELRVLVFDENRTLLTTVLISAEDSPAMQERIEEDQRRMARPPVC